MGGNRISIAVYTTAKDVLDEYFAVIPKRGFTKIWLVSEAIKVFIDYLEENPEELIEYEAKNKDLDL